MKERLKMPGFALRTLLCEMNFKTYFFLKSHLRTIIAQSCLVGFNFLWFYELAVTAESSLFALGAHCNFFLP